MNTRYDSGCSRNSLAFMWISRDNSLEVITQMKSIGFIAEATNAQNRLCLHVQFLTDALYSNSNLTHWSSASISNIMLNMSYGGVIATENKNKTKTLFCIFPIFHVSQRIKNFGFVNIWIRLLCDSLKYDFVGVGNGKTHKYVLSVRFLWSLPLL